MKQIVRAEFERVKSGHVLNTLELQLTALSPDSQFEDMFDLEEGTSGIDGKCSALLRASILSILVQMREY